MPVQPRADISALQRPPHGSVQPHDLRRVGIGQQVIDFSASLNPLGAPAQVLAALAESHIATYPDPSARELRQALADSLNIDSAHLLAGNGSAELIWLAALAYLRPGDLALVVGPTFGEYQRACAVAGARVAEYRVSECQAFRLQVAELCAVVADQSPRLIFLCNPNNPTGQYVRGDAVEAIADACDGLLVVDEAYLPFVVEPDSLVDAAAGGRLLLLRSLTKSYALAGLRLGYAIGARDVVTALGNAQPPWSVNSAAQLAGLAALASTSHIERGRALVEQSKQFLYKALRALGLTVVPSAANFLLVRVGDARNVCRRLLGRGLAVRDCTSFDLPHYIRIGVRAQPECELLVEELGKILHA